MKKHKYQTVTKITKRYALKILVLAAGALLAAKPLLAQTVIWSGADSANSMNWSDANNWNGGSPGPANNIYFYNLGASTSQGTVNNIVTGNTGILSLQYANTNNFHTTQINLGATLTVSNNAAASLVSVGTGTDNGASQTVYTTVTGAGALMVISTNPGSFFSVQQGSTTAGTHPATLNLSGLANFNLAVGRLLVGANAGSAGGSNRLAGTLYLASTNTIQVNGATPAVDVGDATSNGGTDYVYLGQTNAIFADSITIGHSKCTATLAFNSALAGNNPTFYLRGNTNSQVTSLAIGDNSAQTTTATACAGTVNLTGGAVNALVNTCYVAHGENGSGTAATTGTLSLGAGVFNVNTLNVGYMSASTAGAAVTGTNNVYGPGTLVVNSGLVLAYNPGDPTNKATGILNISGGSVLVNAITTSAGGASTINSTINLTDGTLALTNTAGSSTAPLTALNIGDSVLNLNPITALARVFATTVTTTSTTNNTINIASLPPIASYPARLPLIAYGTLNNSDFQLGTLPGPYSGYVLNNTALSSVDLILTSGPITTPTLVWNGNVNTNWDTTTTNWLFSGTPATYSQNAAVVFNDNANETTNVNLTMALTPTSVIVSNNLKNYLFDGLGEITNSVIFTKTGAATLTLAESGGDAFGGAIQVNAGTLILDNPNSAISAGLTVDLGATVQVGNNDANGSLPTGSITDNGTLIFSQSITNLVATAISGGGALTQNGSGVLTLSGANAYTGNTMVNGGTLKLIGSGTISNSPQVLVSGATLDLSGLSGLALLQNLSLANSMLAIAMTNQQTPVQIEGSLSMSGTTNTINILSLPPIASYPTTITLVEAAGGISGFNLGAGNLPAGYSGSVSESGDGLGILLTLTAGPVGVRPSVLWVGTVNASATTNWTDAPNWQLPGAPTAPDKVFFDGTTTVSQGIVNNFVNTNFLVSSLTYDQTTSGAWQVTDIPAGVTLAVTNLTVGAGTAGDGFVTDVAMADAGTLLVLGNLTVGNTGPDSADTGTILDLSGLSNFVFSASAGTIALSTGTRSAANMNFAAASNNLTAGAMNLNTLSQSSSASGTVNLGAGTNIINVGTCNIAAMRNRCTVQFPNGSTGGGLRMRGVGGTDASLANLFLGNHNNAGGSGSSATATLSFNGYPVDMRLGTLTLGQHSNGSEVGSGTGAGTISFDTGTLFASNIFMAITTTANANGVANGTINVGANATLIVGAGGLSLANEYAGTGGTASGQVNITGGTMICSNSITKANAGGTGAITMTDGTLTMVAGGIGSAAVPIDTLNFADSTVTLNVTPTLTNIFVTTLTTGNSTTNDTINVASLPLITSYPVQYHLIIYTSLDNPSLLFGSLPLGYQGYISNNATASMIDLVLTNGPLTIVPTQSPHLTGFTPNFGNGSVVISGTNGQAGATYYLLNSTNVALPLSQWAPVATDVLNSAAFTITNPVNLHGPQQFYILSSTNN